MVYDPFNVLLDWFASVLLRIFASSYGLRRTLSRLSADGWGCIPALLVVWSQHWSLQAVGWGQVLVTKWRPLGELTPMNTPNTSSTSVFVPRVSHRYSRLPRRPSKSIR